MTSQSRAIRSQSREICEIRAFDFMNCGTCDLTDVPASIYDRKMDARLFDYPRYSTMSQSCAISSQRPKCANLAQAGANAYETVGNRPVKMFKLTFLRLCSDRNSKP